MIIPVNLPSATVRRTAHPGSVAVELTFVAIVSVDVAPFAPGVTLAGLTEHVAFTGQPEQREPSSTH